MREKINSTQKTSLAKPAGSDGFTLLEVMIAVAIIALTLVPLLYTYRRSLGFLSEAKSMTIATLLAQRRISELEMTGLSQIEEGEGVFEEEEFSNFKWSVTLATPPFLPPTLPSDLIKEVHVRISWPGNREEGKDYLEMVTYMIRTP